MTSVFLGFEPRTSSRLPQHAFGSEVGKVVRTIVPGPLSVREDGVGMVVILEGGEAEVAALAEVELIGQRVPLASPTSTWRL